MFKNILKISFRNLLKNKAHAFTNVAGLAIGTSAAIVIYFIISYDLSFDTYHADTDRIFRLVQNETTNGELGYESGIPYPLRLKFAEEYPEVEALAYLDQNSGSLITIESDGNKVRYENDDVHLGFTMPSYFKIFKHEFLLGDAESLGTAGNVILSKRMAERFFGNYQDALGKVINYENAVDLTVTGVIANLPGNTDLPHEILIAFETGGSLRIWDSWTATSTSVQAFIKVKPQVDITRFEDKIINY
ncbi:hypothetical protein E1176_10270, partial [Fulvivirga sp. RKSG066]|uniref:ABC transporter permease n=1 Tax=Fulvivirga aurantia TaxID=2529383 RepID=UPI001628EE51